MKAIDYLRIINKQNPHIKYICRNKHGFLQASTVKPVPDERGFFHTLCEYVPWRLRYKNIEFGTTKWQNCVVFIGDEAKYPKAFILEKIIVKKSVKLYPDFLSSTPEEIEEYNLLNKDGQNSYYHPGEKGFKRITFKAISIDENPSDSRIIKNVTWVYGNYELWVRKCFQHNITERYSNVSYEIDRDTLYLFNHKDKTWIKI